MDGVRRDRGTGMNRGHGRLSKRFDWSRTPPSVAVVETIAGVVDSDPAEVEILAQSVDPDALDRLVQGPDNQNPGVRVTLRFLDYEVEVHADGEVVVSPAEE